ncbi:MAG: endopeptidase La [Saprospiraceae bacterium]|nr:endopeptidase La [Saprospiraceae bacterium]
MFDQWKKANKNDDGEVIPLFSITDEDDGNVEKEVYQDTLPLLALKNTVLFPGQVIPITIGRTKSQKALQAAEKGDKILAVIAQRELNVEDPQINDLFKVGTIAKIIKVLKMPDGNTTAILQGRKRFELEAIVSETPYKKAKVQPIGLTEIEDLMEFSATISSIRDLAKRIIELSPHIPSEAIMMLQNIKNDNFLLSFIASNLNISIEEKQTILTIDNLADKAKSILTQMDNELQLLELKDQIESKVRGGIDKQQKEYFLNQQLKTIQEELGQNPQTEEIKKLEERAAKKQWPDSAKEAFNRELGKARRINPQMAEFSVTLNYLELLLDLPWDEITTDNFDLNNVKSVLDGDHHGLNKVKERILEHLAVLKLKGDMKAPIICLVGPPGVGKTSLGKSVANSLNRKFVRMSLGGLHDESEIRGHRKTYIGAMPGRIIQSLKKVKSSNPVFILDEIDKIGKDFRGDPSSALLEVLDPEQNGSFYDNYLELEYDLSKVLFIATANSLNTIQPALRDRMEIIQLSGYSTEEKIQIAKKHLIPKQRVNHGLKAKDINLPVKTIEKIVQEYTREAGVRSLDRTIGSVMRNVAKKVAMETEYNPRITPSEVNSILGPTKVSLDKYTKVDVPGVAVGLAYTSVGGDILFIEASKSKGKGRLNLTGNLGDVMKESATTALSFIKAHSESLGIDPEIFDTIDMHLHVPEGAIPKDGPSAGITMLTAITSCLTGRHIQSHLAMTGEITLRGKVLPVGGIKEKILAAKRAGIKKVILCKENEKHILEIEPEYLKGMEFTYVDTMNEVLEHALNS